VVAEPVGMEIDLIKFFSVEKAAGSIRVKDSLPPAA